MKIKNQTQKRIYLDNGATTRVDDEVLKEDRSCRLQALGEI